MLHPGESVSTSPALELAEGGVAQCFRELALALIAVVEIDQRDAQVSSGSG
jgi:hypothetical protein